MDVQRPTYDLMSVSQGTNIWDDTIARQVIRSVHVSSVENPKSPLYDFLSISTDIILFEINICLEIVFLTIVSSRGNEATSREMIGYGQRKFTGIEHIRYLLARMTTITRQINRARSSIHVTKRTIHCAHEVPHGDILPSAGPPNTDGCLESGIRARRRIEKSSSPSD